MPYTDAGRDLMLNALKGTNPTTPITHAGLFQAGTGKSVTGTASTDTFTSAAHGYSNGDLVVLTAITGGTGLVAGDASNANGLAKPYFVIGVATNTFQLATEPGESAVNFTTDMSAGTVTRLTEISGGSPAYARKAISFNTADDGTMDDSTGPTFDIPALAAVNYAGYYSAVTSGTLLGIDKVTDESFAGQGTYQLSDSDLDLLSA